LAPKTGDIEPPSTKKAKMSPKIEEEKKSWYSDIKYPLSFENS